MSLFMFKNTLQFQYTDRRGGKSGLYYITISGVVNEDTGNSPIIHAL